MNWIEHPLKLEGKRVTLLPLERSHFDELLIAAQDELIWQFMPVNGTDRGKMLANLEEAILLREKGQQYPFVVVENESRKLIGSTRFLKLDPEHRNLEIGFTWYLPDYWSKGYNEDCKLAMLRYCFERLDTVRVQIIAAEKNSRSRNAIQRIGAQFEGVLRQVVVRNGDKRSVAYYSVIDSEWPGVKLNLESLIRQKYK